MAKKMAHDGGTLGETIADKMKDPAFAAEFRRLRFVQEVAVTVRKLRESAGLTQAELAGRMGVSQPIIGRLEGAKDHQPRFDLLDRVAAAVGLGVRVVFCEPGKGAQPLAVIDEGAVARLERAARKPQTAALPIAPFLLAQGHRRPALALKPAQRRAPAKRASQKRGSAT